MIQARRDTDDIVRAARAGDREALDELARRYLPIVYHLVRPVVDAGQVDDVVQDIMVRALRQLGDLKSPAKFRSWLTVIAVHEIGTHAARERRTSGRAASLGLAVDRPDAAADVEGPAVLRVELDEQRRQVRHAAQWMGPAERTVFALWWLELIGELTRAEVAVGLGVGVPHAGVRIQRMREQLETGRGIVAALEAVPGCDLLGEVVAGWDGIPGPYWRKRIGRHVRSCPVCTRTARPLVPADRLLPALLLLPVPVALASATLAKTAGVTPAVTTGVAQWAGGVVQAAVAHPLAAAIGAGVLAVGVTVPATGWATAPALPHRTGSGSSQPGAASPLRTGPVSLESVAAPGRYVTVFGEDGALEPVGPASAAADRERATLRAVPGLADPSCISLIAPDNRYLRHSSFRLQLGADEGTVLFRGDATFCGRTGSVTGSVSLESFNYRGFYLRRVGDQLWIDQSDGSDPFRTDSSFFARPPLA
ncbi:sigma-70 family RNA polymerase sigma factor [Actinoplanes sp. LDG1-06]|uniref:Sigma-70 family RNA polymerase sigma factor n=1 Tax=Paractinoplanes ovalisporus TaxID=2810368 RepID=A0ABS2AHT0_9ACTN|nr:sigma-70 family RNA polymerase sigma factor [Actinoplanes ovalisporus]MBM2619372.1 sigma-70 family RNA polymerase sigma factor [Actinoplanes ovalisporus]